MNSWMLISMAALCGFVSQIFSAAPAQWQVRAPLPLADDLVFITYGSGGFIMADDGGFVLKSPDAKTWRQYGGLLRPRELVYEEGRFVAVTWEGTDGAIFTSSDGTSWQHRLTSLGDLAAITYGNGLYVAAGEAGIFVSDDGAIWTRRSEVSGQFYRDVAYANGKFVAVGQEFTNSSWHSRVASSSNGVDWTFVTLPETNLLRAVAGGAGVFVSSGDGRPIMTSTDAEHWTLQGFFESEPHYPPPADIRTITYGNGTFVAGGNGHRIYYSTNGTDWLGGCFNCYGPSWTPFAPVKSIAFGNGQFIAVAENNTMYATADPRQWTVVMSEDDLYSVAYGNGRFVATGSNATIWVSSNTGNDWSFVFGGIVDSHPVRAINGVAFGTNMFAAVGGPGPYVATSPDGVHWTRQLAMALSTGETLNAVTYGNGLFVAVGEWERTPGLEPRIRTSGDTNWPSQSFVAPASAQALYGAAYGNGIFVVVGDQGTVLSSPDGTNWTPRASGTSRTLRAATHHNGRFFAGGDVGTILTSTNGIDWSASAPTSFSNRGLGSGDGVVAVGSAQSEGRLHYSSDGLGWPGSSLAFPEILNDVAYGNGAWVAVGNSGLILQAFSHEIRLFDPRYTNGGFEMKIVWPVGRTHRVQSSTNLVDWETLSTHIADTSPYLYRDATALSYRFYRVVSP